MHLKIKIPPQEGRRPGQGVALAQGMRCPAGGAPPTCLQPEPPSQEGRCHMENILSHPISPESTT